MRMKSQWKPVASLALIFSAWLAARDVSAELHAIPEAGGARVSILPRELSYWNFVSFGPVFLQGIGETVTSIEAIHPEKQSTVQTAPSGDFRISCEDVRSRDQFSLIFRARTNLRDQVAIRIECIRPEASTRLGFGEERADLKPGRSFQVSPKALQQDGRMGEARAVFSVQGGPGLIADRIFEAKEYMKRLVVLVTALDLKTRERATLPLWMGEEGRSEWELFPNGVPKAWSFRSPQGQLLIRKEFYGRDLPRSMTVFFPSGKIQHREYRFPNGKLKQVEAFQEDGRRIYAEIYDSQGKLTLIETDGEVLTYGNK